MRPGPGVLCHVDFERLVATARDADCVVGAGARVWRVRCGRARRWFAWTATPRLDLDDARRRIVLGFERTLEQDVAYGLRLLVDIAERSLADSPFLDPTTAVQAIDRLHDCLRHHRPARVPRRAYTDSAGVVRLVVRVMNWDGYVHLAYDEIRQAGAGYPQVARRLRASLDDLLEYAPPNGARYSTTNYGSLNSPFRNRCQSTSCPLCSADRQGIGVAAASTAHSSSRCSIRNSPQVQDGPRRGRTPHGY